MKALVVDDDEMVRLALGSLLKTSFLCRVVEAGNGLDALALIESEAPDIVFLDVLMPLMDGSETLAALRADPQHRRLPVVVMSGAADRDVVKGMIQLGVADYLLKPLRPAAIQGRLAKVLGAVEDRPPASRRAPRVAPPAAAAAVGDARVVLVADQDPGFRAFCSAALGRQYEVVEAGDGVEVLRFFVDRRADLVCLGERLGLANPSMVAAKIRALCGAPAPRIFLCADRAELAEAERALYDGLLRRSFVPDTFRAELTRLALGAPAGGDLVGLLRQDLEPELVTAVRQTFGVMTMQEVSVVDGKGGDALPAEVRAAVTLGAADGASIDVAVSGSRRDVAAIAARLSGAEANGDAEALDALGEIANIVAGRVGSWLGERGVRATPAPPCLETSGQVPDGAPAWRLAIPFETAARERFGVTVTADMPAGPPATAPAAA